MTDTVTEAMIEAGRAATLATGSDPVSAETLEAIYLAMTTAAPEKEIVGMLVEALNNARNDVEELADKAGFNAHEWTAPYDTALKAARKQV
jgi:hypothetical protein